MRISRQHFWRNVKMVRAVTSHIGTPLLRSIDAVVCLTITNLPLADQPQRFWRRTGSDL